MLSSTNRTALQTLHFVQIELFGEPTQTETLPFGLSELRHNNRVRTIPVAQLLIRAFKKTTWLTTNCEKMLTRVMPNRCLLTTAGDTQSSATPTQSLSVPSPTFKRPAVHPSKLLTTHSSTAPLKSYKKRDLLSIHWNNKATNKPSKEIIHPSLGKTPP